MGILSRLFGSGSGGGNAGNHESVVEAIVAQYRERRLRGELYVDDRLFNDIAQVLPKNEAQEVFERFRRRRSRSDHKAEPLLLFDLGVAMHDVEHYTKNFKPIIVPRQPEVPDRTPPSAAKTYQKVMDGCPLTADDEDAVLFQDLLRDK